MVEIKKYPFSISGQASVESEKANNKIDWSKNWPVVYIITNDDEAYIGETTKINCRISEHLKNTERQRLKQIHILIDDKYNKSATLDIESSLIRYMSSDNKFKLQNGNSGLVANDYYNKEIYKQKFTDEIWPKLKSLQLVNADLKDIENSNIFKYSPYTTLSGNQYEVVLQIVKEIFDNRKSDRKMSIIVNGGAGTGKTVLGVYLMKLLTKDQENFEEDNLLELLKEIKLSVKNVALVIPQQSLRKTLKNVFKGTYGLNADMVISPNDVPKKDYDLLIVDESHRLRKRKNLPGAAAYKSYDENNKKLHLSKEGTELDWIMAKSKYQIFFYDKNQSIRPADIDNKSFMNKIQQNKCVFNFNLSSQFRVLAGAEYIKYIYSILNCELVDKKSFQGYEFKLFKNIHKLYELIKKKNDEFGLSRLVAGYSWEWQKKKTDYTHDIEIEGLKFKWNTESEDWINSPNSVNEVGCIHTVQGYDLNYIGVIIGPEISYDEKTNKIVVDPNKYFDRNGKQGIESLDELKEYIKNIYGVLLTRGIRGTYIYVCDDKLRKYLEKYIDY